MIDYWSQILLSPRSWNKRKSHSSWKSIFTRQPRQSNSNQDIKEYSNPTTPTNKDPPVIVTNGRALNEERSVKPDQNGAMKESNSGVMQEKMTKSKIILSITIRVHAFISYFRFQVWTYLMENRLRSIRAPGPIRLIAYGPPATVDRFPTIRISIYCSRRWEVAW